VSDADLAAASAANEYSEIAQIPGRGVLRFTFTNPDLDTTIVGTINPEHLQTNLEILRQWPLPPDLYEEAKKRLAAAGSAQQAGGG
jgi:aryl-alcohol dehydrogenase-like predicted oxidoreductase